MRKEYYIALRDHIKKDAEGIQYVGRFNNQYEKENAHQSIDYPNVLLKFQYQGHRDNAGEGIQEFDILMTAYIGNANFENEGEDILDLAEEVNASIYRFVPEGAEFKMFGKPQRVDEREDNDHDQIMVHEIDYLIHVRDYTTQRQRTKKTLTENISVTLS